MIESSSAFAVLADRVVRFGDDLEPRRMPEQRAVRPQATQNRAILISANAWAAVAARIRSDKSLASRPRTSPSQMKAS
jgi:hypothetical protein